MKWLTKAKIVLKKRKLLKSLSSFRFLAIFAVRLMFRLTHFARFSSLVTVKRTHERADSGVGTVAVFVRASHA